ncbi:spore cortex biosynthesis protein YabQ [Mesobacillus foraminis]|uniref:Spore cortex biosynthesis protein YabQ n=1 Tax=Mesobacillus foraminis TaxID=279826 RepID=A0A4R2AV06_9BACI|nr:spore cortex biosynthesis protein YabQ [Mesobacillus foraminis]TCN17661.1 spore cortex biosynthesis protein YabQ [Mesobacillus foraminis]
MTLSTQFLTMLAMIGMGSLFGASLDTYNRFLQRHKRKTWIIFINDILFWVYQGLSVFYVLFSVNQGELRFYIFIALLCGFAAYQSLIKRLYLKILDWVISLAVASYRLSVKIVFTLIYRPLRFLTMAIVSLLLLAGKGIWSLLKTILAILLWILRVAGKPFEMLLSYFWKLLPKKIKKTVERLYNRLAGFTDHLKNYTVKLIDRIKKIKK